VYAIEEKLPIHLQIPMLHLMHHFIIYYEALQGQRYQLVELDESRRHAFDQMVRTQDNIKGIFYDKEGKKKLEE
jgi:hypothetical protein